MDGGEQGSWPLCLRAQLGLLLVTQALGSCMS